MSPRRWFNYILMKLIDSKSLLLYYYYLNLHLCMFAYDFILMLKGWFDMNKTCRWSPPQDVAHSLCLNNVYVIMWLGSGGEVGFRLATCQTNVWGQRYHLAALQWWSKVSSWLEIVYIIYFVGLFFILDATREWVAASVGYPRPPYQYWWNWFIV